MEKRELRIFFIISLNTATKGSGILRAFYIRTCLHKIQYASFRQILRNIASKAFAIAQFPGFDRRHTKNDSIVNQSFIFAAILFSLPPKSGI